MPASPDATEVAKLREVLGLKTITDATSRVTALSQEEWDLQILDNAAWWSKRDKYITTRGGKPFEAWYDPQSLLGRIRNRSRLRFGLDAITTDAATDADLQKQENVGAGGLCSGKWFDEETD